MLAHPGGHEARGTGGLTGALMVMKMMVGWKVVAMVVVALGAVVQQWVRGERV